MSEIIELNGKKYQLIEEEKKEYKRWRAKKGEKFYSLDMAGIISYTIEDNTKYCDRCYNINNYFQTEQEPIKERDKRLAVVRVNDRILELNEGWKEDWKNRDQKKWHIMYLNDTKLFEYGYNMYTNEGTLLIRMKSKEIAEQIIQEHEEDLKLIFDIGNNK